MADEDGSDWTEIEAFDAASAAELYVEKCDDDSGGAMMSNHSDRRTVLVKLRSENEPLRYDVSMEYSKTFFAARAASAVT
jgi:hypothetical protein